MSLISDALKKAELQRSQPASARTSIWDRTTTTEAEPRPPSRSSRFLFVANVAVLALICFSALYFVRNNQSLSSSGSSEIDSPSLSSESSVTTIESRVAPTPLAENASARDTLTPSSASIAQSPFVPAAFNPAHNAPVTEEYSLGGISTLGSNTLLSVIRKSDKRSIWVPVGKTVGEVTAVSYDADNDRAVIRVRGQHLSVTMDSLAGSPVSAPDTQ